MTAQQAAERQARHERLIGELVAALERAANSAGFQYMTYETREAIDAVLARAKEQQS
ncbi:hypothetical protein [Cupriavidus necator]|uniref:hypothetical protein n=1 Tax=Cupriavidus necator TaxID=106590 RepID=UPI00148F5862|nr:hypothetical protein [Cupriavidus necator]